MTVLFGEKLRLLRRERQLSQSELARRVGLSSHAVLSNLESGRKEPSLDLALTLACALETTFDYLLRDDIPAYPVVLAAATDAPARAVSERRFGDRLRTLRHQRALTQEALAHQLGLTTNAYISYLESGQKEPSLEIVQRLAVFFGITIDALLRSAAEPLEEN